jgi:hypothetical protein
MKEERAERSSQWSLTAVTDTIGEDGEGVE